MQKLIIADSSAIWLEHIQLINESYKESVTNSDIYYKMRKELFCFNASKKKAGGIMEYECKVTKKSKRKRQSTLIENTESGILKLKENIELFLEKLREMGAFAHFTEVNTPMLQRYWEEGHVFPKFCGLNYTNEFQKFSFGEQIYIIPASSKFFNHDVTKLNDIIDKLQIYDLIVIDPPWHNKYVKRLKRLKLELAYYMLDSTEIYQLPIEKLINRHTLVAIWCTNAPQNQRAVLERFIPAWNLRLLQSIRWMKLTTCGTLIGNINEEGKKQPYEMLYIACHKEEQRDFSNLQAVELLISIPSIIHSHKPPLLRWLQEYLPAKPKCLELFARYLQPHFTSIGLEVLKLMDERLYERIDKKVSN